MRFLNLALGVAPGAEVLEDNIGVILDVMGGLLAASVLTVELDTNEVSFHVAVRNPVRESLFLLIVGVAAITAVTSRVSAAAAGALGGGEGVTEFEGVDLWNEVVAGTDGFQAFLDGVPVVGPLELPILP